MVPSWSFVFMMSRSHLVADLYKIFRLRVRIVAKLVSRDVAGLLSTDVNIHFGGRNAYNYTVHLFVCI